MNLVPLEMSFREELGSPKLPEIMIEEHTPDRMMKTPFLILLCHLLLFCVISCEKHAERPSMQEKLKDVTTITGMVFPPDAVLLNAATAERGLDEWCAWGLRSVHAFDLPAPEQSVLQMDIDAATSLVKVLTKDKRIANVTEALSGEWTKEDHMYRGTLVRSSDGYYLAIEQYQKAGVYRRR